MNPSRARAILRRTATGTGLVLALVLLVLATDAVGGAWPVLVVGAALSVGLVLELAGMGTWRERRVLVPGLAAAAVTVAVLAVSDHAARGALAYAAAAGVSLALAFALRSRAPFATSGAVVWLVVALPVLAVVWERFGQGGLIALLVLSKVGDIAGYYGGNALGRHHPFPRLSPGKTTEGCLASFLAGCAAGPLCGALGLVDGAFGWPALVLAGALTNLAAQSGDLFESFVKRRAGVKDSGTLLGPSGGLIDVCDSLLFTVPVALATWPFLFSATAHTS